LLGRISLNPVITIIIIIIIIIIIRYSFPATGLSRPLGIRKVKASGFSRLSAL
jgi:hypothetical protein